MMKMKRVRTLPSPICKTLISRWKKKIRKRRSLRPLSYLPNLSTSNRDKLLSSSIKPHRGRQINLNSRLSICSTRRLRLVPPYPKMLYLLMWAGNPLRLWFTKAQTITAISDLSSSGHNLKGRASRPSFQTRSRRRLTRSVTRSNSSHHHSNKSIRRMASGVTPLRKTPRPSNPCPQSPQSRRSSTRCGRTWRS